SSWSPRTRTRFSHSVISVVSLASETSTSARFQAAATISQHHRELEAAAQRIEMPVAVRPGHRGFDRRPGVTVAGLVGRVAGVRVSGGQLDAAQPLPAPQAGAALARVPERLAAVVAQ